MQIIKKRFSEISDFHKSSGIKEIEEPPKKAIKSNLTEQFLKERKNDLGSYLTKLMLIKGVLNNTKFIQFFELSSLEQKKKDSFFCPTKRSKTNA